MSFKLIYVIVVWKVTIVFNDSVVIVHLGSADGVFLKNNYLH